MRPKTNKNAVVRVSFIETFARGDKSQAIRNLINEGLSSHRLDGVAVDDSFIYEALAAGSLAEPFVAENFSQAEIA